MQFVDSNVLLYLVSTDPQEAAKQSVAERILESGNLALSVQVLQEFYVQATRPRPNGRGSITHQQAVALIEAFKRFPVQETTVAILDAALSTKARYGISFWDAAIIEAARAIGCETVLSEDLSHGRIYGSVRIENPFV